MDNGFIYLAKRKYPQRRLQKFAVVRVTELESHTGREKRQISFGGWKKNVRKVRARGDDKKSV